MKRQPRAAAPDLFSPVFPLAGEVLGGMPGILARRIFSMLADLSWSRRGESVRQLEENLLPAMEYSSYDVRLRALSRANMQSFARYQYELSTLRELTKENVPDPINMIGYKIIEQAFLAGNGVVLAVPRMANLEYAGAYLAKRFGTVTTVASRFAPERIFESLVEARKNLSIEVLPLAPVGRRNSGSGNPAAVFLALAQRLRNGGLVCLVADYPASNSVEVELFGANARLPAGPAALALYTGAVLLPAALWYEGDGWSGRVYDAIPNIRNGAFKINAAEMTRALAGAFERALVGHLEDWYITRPLYTSLRLSVRAIGSHPSISRAKCRPIAARLQRHPTESACNCAHDDRFWMPKPTGTKIVASAPNESGGYVRHMLITPLPSVMAARGACHGIIAAAGVSAVETIGAC